eukprot:1141396-Pelagomonas_calceolata.AAC.5
MDSLCLQRSTIHNNLHDNAVGYSGPILRAQKRSPSMPGTTKLTPYLPPAFPASAGLQPSAIPAWIVQSDQRACLHAMKTDEYRNSKAEWATSKHVTYMTNAPFGTVYPSSSISYWVFLCKQRREIRI